MNFGKLASKTLSRSILIADDDQDILTSLSAHIEEQMLDFSIETTLNGSNAVKMWEEKKHCLVILDLMLPGKSGLLVTQEILARKKGHDRPVILMITGNPGSRHEVYSRDLGVEGYLRKPFKTERLIKMIEEILPRLFTTPPIS